MSKPDKYHRHEAMHMALFLCNSVDSELVEHEYIKSDTECMELAQKAHQALFDLYQLIGQKHLGD